MSAARATEIRARAEAIAGNATAALLGELPVEVALSTAVVHAEKILRQLDVAEQERRLAAA